MQRPTQIAIPTLVRVKDGALDRLGLYLGRGGHKRVAVLVSKGLTAPLPERTAADPSDRAEWLAAVRAAPAVKANFYTVLSSRDVLPEVERHLTDDARLARCFR
jgi:predicted cobalt transporter CbtA